MHDGVFNFSSAQPPSSLTITQIENSMESLPIANPGSVISLHFTQPADEVITGGSRVGEVFDIEALEDADLEYDLNLKVA